MDSEKSERRRCAAYGWSLPVALVTSVLMAGCSTLCPADQRVIENQTGQIQQSYPACRSLQVVDQRVERGPEGKLRVTAEWRNLDDEPYPARIRVLFLADGEPEATGGTWSTYEFQPGGGNVVKFFSSTARASSYRIEVRSKSSGLW